MTLESLLVALLHPSLDVIELVGRSSISRTICEDDADAGAESFQLLLQHRPITSPWNTPLYSNQAFQLIGYALQVLTNKTYEAVLKESVFGPLNLSSSFVFAPAAARGVQIPKNSIWPYSIGDEAPAGNLYMSTNDMATHIQAILGNKQLSARDTRRWLKPISHTADLRTSIGAPWEIFRAPASSSNPYYNIDLYRKSGGVGEYSSMYGLIPEHAAGYAINVVREPGGTSADELETIIVNSIVPALTSIAKEQDITRLAGRYVAKGLNSSMVLTSDNEIGLLIQSWISNSTNMYETLAKIGNQNENARIYPMGLEVSRSNSTLQQLAFRIVFPPPHNAAGCISWANADNIRYANQPLDELIFETGSDGVATSIFLPGLRVRLMRQT